MPSQQVEALETITALKRKLKREKDGKPSLVVYTAHIRRIQKAELLTSGLDSVDCSPGAVRDESWE